ncbi:hypothetical protein [Asanoa hainanensis]|uniref:hypothetical protein n=1 Tax=Asanoa hainanensis TaxID=560556 RepID=UPI000B7822D1|nr:hypothetical protein [Asanoa hainanensis]
MERAELISLLAGATPAEQACRAALEQGATFHVYAADEGVPASNLASSYRRRQAHTTKLGIPTIGFAEAVETLSALGEQPLVLGSVAQEDSPRSFVIFLAPDATSVIACLGVG